ncbi:ribonuclease P [Raphidocelis subcapitata]|uniref:Ribonuclease P n=1 Tax=Raphidocelis subcapitata TaxID=307507 RepID=A0A2V0NR71_9CHLO|nr:ribonuclease P [Raphidocelis subcapitata]|eukprot:GBF88053.1 ribonuclease P [Raphidocelis subcapitata]
MAAAMQAAGARTAAAAGRPMGAAAPFAVARRPARPVRVVVVRAVDEDAELEARLAKLKAAKGETTDAEKRQARAARLPGGVSKPAAPAKPQYDFSGETLHWEGAPANGDLLLNIALGATLVWLPLTFGAIGRRVFLKYRFTDKRISVSDTFPTYGKSADVPYQEVLEVRTVPRGLGAWGDMVIVLRNGDKVEIRSLEKFQELKEYILQRRDALTGRAAGAAAAAGGGRPSVMDLDADDAAVGLGGGAKKGKGFSS